MAKNYIYCLVKERVDTYIISLYVFIRLRENIYMAGAVAVLYVGCTSQAGFYMQSYA
jgi:hypothetical protein